MNYTIQTANFSQIKQMVDWAKQEGWNPGLNDYQLLQFADTNGFFIGILGNEPIAAISNVKYSNDFSFLGLYIVKPEFRKQGYGLQIWNHCLKYSGAANCGLDGVVSQQENYKKSGFTLAYQNVRYELAQNNISGHKSEYIVTTNNIISDILKYDKAFFPASRQAFLSRWLQDTNANALVFREGNKVSGYGVIRKCYTGYKIGPLFADTYEIAVELFSSLCSLAKLGEPVYLDIPEPNSQAKKLVGHFAMNSVFETARMYNKHSPEISIDRTYGITTFEIG